jgi:outer membrane receptor protein involved in Fe transport
MSPTSSNVTNDRVKNEKSFSTELGYSFHNRWLVFKANAYYTKWLDKSMTKKGKITEQYYINMTGVHSKHMGLEFELRTTPAQWVEAGAMLSLGNWKWDSDNVKGYAYTLSGQAVTPDGGITTPGAPDHAYATINMKGIHIGGSAQTTSAIDVTFKPFAGFRIGGGFTHYSRNYAYYSLSGSSLKLGKEMNVVEPWKIPSYGCFDLWSSYKFMLGSLHATVSGQVNNVFDNHYIEKAWNPTTASQNVVSVNPDDVYLFYSIGRIWSVKLKIDF